MVDKPQYLTRDGLEQLEKRLDYLIKVRRPEVADRLKQALEDGGELTENTEYEDAKNEQAFIEAEITRASNILRHARIIDENTASDVVAIGVRVTIAEQGTKDKETYQIVGPAESNPEEGKLSFESPLGKALMGKKVKDKVTVKAPDGDITFVIKEIG